VATATSSVARAGTAGQAARAVMARGQAMSADVLEGEGGRRPGDKGTPAKKGLPLMLIVIVVVAIIPIALSAYVMLAPDTMWKPLYVRVETEDATPMAGASSAAGAAGSAAPAADGQAAQTQQHLPPLQPPAPAVLATVPPLQPPGPGAMYQMGTKVVNLADPGGLRYLQVAIVLELHPELGAYLAEQDAAMGTAPAGGEAPAGGHGEAASAADTGSTSSALDSRRPIIDDAVMTALSSKRFNDIATIKGKQALKEELITAINKALGVPGVLNVYFTEFVVQ
jgi:flagellar protein FliL